MYIALSRMLLFVDIQYVLKYCMYIWSSIRIHTYIYLIILKVKLECFDPVSLHHSLYL